MKRSLKLLGAVACCLSLLVASPGQGFMGADEQKPSQDFKTNIRVSGGGAAISWMFAPAHESFEQETGIGLTITMNSPGQGLADLAQDKADVATSAVPLDDMVKAAAKAGVTVDPSTLKTVVLGKNRTLVFLHRSNAIPALSKEQLKGIFTGAITNWKDVGGADGEIVVVWGTQTPGQNGLFTKAILDGETVTAKAREATHYRDIMDKVSAEPRAVGIDPAGFASGSTRTPKIPEIVSPIIAVTKGQPSAEIQRLYDFLAKVEAE